MGIGKVVIFGSVFVTSKPHTQRNLATMRAVYHVSLMRISAMTAMAASRLARFRTACEVRRKSVEHGAGRVADRSGVRLVSFFLPFG